MFLIQFAIVLICILIGARLGGIGLGVMGGIGLAVLTFGFGLKSGSPPIDVMFIIIAVVSAAAAMQASGGLNYMIKIAVNILRKNPKYITFIAPAVTYIFTFLCGTGHVAYSVLPVIAEVSRNSGIRPERPMSMAVIASQFAIVASPIAAAVVAMVALLEPYNISLIQVLSVTITSTVVGILIAAIIVNKMGKELKDDPIYKERLSSPDYQESAGQSVDFAHLEVTKNAKISVSLFLLATLLIVIMGAFPSLRPVYDGKTMGMADTIQIVMLSAAAVIMLVCKPKDHAITQGSVFHAGMRAVVAIFGIAWLGDTLVAGHLNEIKEGVSNLVHAAPWAFALALFALSIMVNSQGATTVVLVPLGLSIGVSPEIVVATFVAVNGYFFIPNYGPIIASIDFDTTGTTKIGKYIFNHSFMLPGLLSLIFSLIIGLAIAPFIIG